MDVGHGIKAKNAGWTFGGAVPDTFVDHIRQSVPFYDEGHELICQLSDFFCGTHSVCYELGAATGELTRKLARYHATKPDIRWIAVDSEPSMVLKAKQHCAAEQNVSVHCEDLRLLDYEKADLFVSYYTMQFVPPRDRQQVFDRIYESLHWGGALIVFEKVRGPDARFQDMLTALHADFKIRQGLSAAEVLSKTRSLKGILEPFSTEGNLGLLRRAGFVDVMTIYKYLCFEGFVAIK